MFKCCGVLVKCTYYFVTQAAVYWSLLPANFQVDSGACALRFTKL